MRTKALLCLAALAAGAATSLAQVYSLNIVGYATVNVPAGYSIMANPLKAGNTNGANEIMSVPDGAFFLLWKNGAYNYVGFDSGYGGWVDSANNPSVPPVLAPGTGFFFFNPGDATTITFVGEVVPGPGATASTTIAPGYSLLGSTLPVSGYVTNATYALPQIDGQFILKWASGGFSYYGFDSGYGGWVDSANNAAAPPQMAIGEGFFYFNPGDAATWTQSLP